MATDSDGNFWLDTSLIQAENVQSVGGEFLTILGPFSLQGEYIMDTLRNASFPATGTHALGDPTFFGYYAQASYFLTGENRAYDRRFGRMTRIKPFTNFWMVRTDEGCCKGIGAWEVAARYSVVDLNDTRVVAGTGGQLTEYTLGLNWYLNSNMKIQWNYVRANRDVALPNASGNVDEFGMRFHIDF